MLHDAYLINESFVFYHHHSQSTDYNLASPLQDQLMNKSTSLEGENNSAPKPQAPMLCKSASNDLSCGSSNSSGRFNERWQEFCDNLSFSIRSRLFIMESNFKHRLRATRKYLLKQLPPNWASRAATATRNSQSVVESSKTTERQFRFPEPNSTKSLGVQQECLLARLKRIKNEMRTVVSEQLEEPQIDYIDNQEQDEQVELGTGGRPMFESAGARVSGGEESAQSDDSPLSAQVVMAQSTTKKRRWIARGSQQLMDTLTGSKQKCIVCYERAPNIVTLPCKHSDICSDCFIEIIFLAVKHSQYPLRCVLCRQKVERIRCSRRLLLSVIERKRGRKCAGK